jgi:hypothetical protein
LIDFGIVGVGTLFPDSSCFFPQGFHCTGFNEVDGEAGLMEDRSLHLVIREVWEVSAREEGVCWKKLLGAERTALSVRCTAARVEWVALSGERTLGELRQGAQLG